MDPIGSDPPVGSPIRWGFGRPHLRCVRCSTPDCYMAAPTLLHPRAGLIEVGDGRRVRLLHVLGQGASSVVHQGLLEHRSGLRRLVALKLFGNVSSEDAEQVLALAARTASRAACIRHPNVVEVYDFGLWRGQPYFINE